MSQNTCPECGGKKDYRSSLCQQCGRYKNRTFVITDIDPSWAYAFAGLFMGEGSLGLYLDKRARGSVHARASLKMRADETPLLEDVHEKLGARLYYEKKGDKYHVAWATTNTKQVLSLCLLLEMYTPFPAHKLGDVAIVKEFVIWRIDQPYRVESWDFAHELRAKLLKYRSYNFVKG